MSRSLVICPDCGVPFHARNGVTATVLWAEHWAEQHKEDT